MFHIGEASEPPTQYGGDAKQRRHIHKVEFLVDLSCILLHFSESSDNTGIVVITVTHAVILFKNKSNF